MKPFPRSLCVALVPLPFIPAAPRSWQVYKARPAADEEKPSFAPIPVEEVPEGSCDRQVDARAVEYVSWPES